MLGIWESLELGTICQASKLQNGHDITTENEQNVTLHILELDNFFSTGQVPMLIKKRGEIKVGIPNFVSGPREYIMEGEYVILAMCSWFCIS